MASSAPGSSAQPSRWSWRFDSLWPPIAFHALIDLGAGVMALLALREVSTPGGERRATIDDPNELWLALVNLPGSPDNGYQPRRPCL